VILVVLATAYCLSGHTATGTTVASGTIATDPRIIPLHSRLHVPGYGRGVALDTGSAVKGLHIDLWMRSCAKARAWGVRHVRITVKEVRH
jgi:3D (Asp-Asp-Asp) domain-containing protein